MPTLHLSASPHLYTPRHPSIMPITVTHNIDAVVDGQIYIGNLAAAKSIDLRRQFGITHLLSVCQDIPPEGPNHLVIPVQDSEYDDILIHLPDACRFIKNTVESGGRVLVHCYMGISRSATVIAAYLMSSRQIPVQKAIAIIKRARPQIQPNYGFIKSLYAFEACRYSVSSTDATYRTWKRRHLQDVTCFLNNLSDTTVIIPEKLSLSSDFPSDPERAASLVSYLGFTHCISLSPFATFPTNIGFKHNHIEIPQCNKAGLLLALPSICKTIQDVLDNRGRILIHCLTESTAAIVACAYVMWSRHISYKQAYMTLHDALPLFNPTDNFTQLLELYAACNCSPYSGHPALQNWRTPGMALSTPLTKQYLKPGGQVNHSLSSLRPVVLDG